jgi:HK97 family phage major capsid protein
VRTIPQQLYAGRVVAFGSYGLPTFAGRQITGRQLVILGFVAALFALYAAGVFDLAQVVGGGIVLGAGPTVTELADDYEGKQKALKAYLDEHKKDDVDSEGRPIFDLDGEGVKRVREMNADLDKAHDALKAAREVSGAYDKATADHGVKSQGRVNADFGRIEQARPSLALQARSRLKALIEESAESGGLKAVRDVGLGNFKGERLLFEIGDPEEADSLIEGVKATITLADITPQATRLPEIVPSAQSRITVSDLMAPGTMDGNTISYYEETTFTNAAVETAEGIAKPESTLDFTERTETARKIPTWIPLTDEALNDNRQLRSYVEGRLMFMVGQREEQQLIVGDGTAPNISGILDRSGIQTQAKGADPTPDAFFKAFTKVQVTGDADPSGFVIHPNDWQDVRLLRTADGIYIFGAPNDEVQVRMWGWPGRVTTGITEGTGLVGAFRTMSQVFRREGLRIVASTEHASFFVENKVALLAETRLALAVYRPAAFCQVTGI